MNTLLLLSIPITNVILFIASLYITSKSNKFGKIFLIHVVVFLTYFTVWYFFGKDLVGKDPHGLYKLFLIIFIILGHNIIGFIHALTVRRELQKIKNEDIIDA